MSGLRRFAARLADLTVAVTPATQNDWATAMTVEVESIENDVEALRFALGCLWAAIQQRFGLKAIAGARVFVAMITIAYALFHLAGVANIAPILLGRPDPFCEMLIANGNLAAAAWHEEAHPWIAAFLAAMGLSHLFAGIFLLYWRPWLFAVAVSVAIIPAFYTLWPFAPLILLVAAAVILNFANSRLREPSLHG